MAAETFIPSLAFEVCDGPAGARSVLLSQDSGGSVNRIELHSLHVRLLAAELGADDLEIERLHRALLRSWDLAASLRRDLQLTASFGHEDLDAEIARATELVDFLAFICADFHDRYEPLPQAQARGQSQIEPNQSDLFGQGAKS